MPTKDYGRLYFTTVKLPRTPAPPTSIAVSKMTQPPWRTGYGVSFNRTWLVPLPFLLFGRWWLATFATWLVNRRWPRGYVVGWWASTPTDDLPWSERLLRAAGGREHVAPRQEIRRWVRRRRRWGG